MKIICLCSGGIDSIVMATLLLSQGHDIYPLHIDYGQVTSKPEQESLLYCAKEVGLIEPIVLQLPSISRWGSGTLVETDSYNEMFPHRNLFLIASAAIVASKIEADAIAIGIFNVASAPFADCRKPFVTSLNSVLEVDEPKLTLLTPLAEMTKAQIVSMGLELGVPLSFTFSCNKMSHRHCWQCESCLERIEYFSNSSIDL